MSKISKQIELLYAKKEKLSDELNSINDKLIELKVTEAIYLFNNEFKKHNLPLPNKILIEATSEYDDVSGYYYCLGGLSLINSEYDEVTNEYHCTLYESIHKSISDIVWGQNDYFSYEFDMNYSDCEVD